MSYSLRKTAGLILWWAEGTKAYKDKRWKNSWVYSVDFTNTNPLMIKIFLHFLRKDIKINEQRLKAQLQIHEGDDQKYLENYWSWVTKIPTSRFTKTIIRPTGNKIGKTKGTCKIRYSDKKIYNKIDTALSNLLKKIHGV